MHHVRTLMLQWLQGKEADVVQSRNACIMFKLRWLQGKEADVVLFSCVRAHDGGSGERGRGVGFLADVRRMNVGLTRARYTILPHL